MIVPQNEMGVIVLFSQAIVNSSRFEIARIGALFPDSTVIVDGESYETEFEYSLSSFLTHGHDIRKCDLVICWENDFGKFPIPVIELRKNEWENLALFKPNDNEVEIFYWKYRARIAEKKLKRFKMTYLESPFSTKVSSPPVQEIMDKYGVKRSRAYEIIKEEKVKLNGHSS